LRERNQIPQKLDRAIAKRQELGINPDELEI
jgi:hypothetical protein